MVASQQELILAQAREIVGSGTQLDVQRAEVALGLQRVQALKARNQVEIEKLRLFQLMGTAQPPNVKLVSQFPVTPTVARSPAADRIGARPEPGRPGASLAGARGRPERAAREGRVLTDAFALAPESVATPTATRTPNFPVQQAVGAVRCRSRELHPHRGGPRRAQPLEPARRVQRDGFHVRRTHRRFATAIRDFRSTSPNHRDPSPRCLSLPLFDGFAREQRLQEAMASRSDARYGVRARELALTADVTAAYLTADDGGEDRRAAGAERGQGAGRSSSSCRIVTRSGRRRSST